MGRGIMSLLTKCRVCYSVYRQISAILRPDINISPTSSSKRTGTHGRGKDIGTNKTGMHTKEERSAAVNTEKISTTETEGKDATRIRKNLAWRSYAQLCTGMVNLWQIEAFVYEESLVSTNGHRWWFIPSSVSWLPCLSQPSWSAYILMDRHNSPAQKGL